MTKTRIEEIIELIKNDKEIFFYDPEKTLAKPISIPLNITDHKGAHRLNKYKVPVIYIDDSSCELRVLNSKKIPISVSISNHRETIGRMSYVGYYDMMSHSNYHLTKDEMIDIIKYLYDNNDIFMPSGISFDFVLTNGSTLAPEYIMSNNKRYFSRFYNTDSADGGNVGLSRLINDMETLRDYHVNDSYNITLLFDVPRHKGSYVDLLQSISEVVSDHRGLYDIKLKDIDEYNEAKHEKESNDFHYNGGLVKHEDIIYFKPKESNLVLNMDNIFSLINRSDVINMANLKEYHSEVQLYISGIEYNYGTVYEMLCDYLRSNGDENLIPTSDDYAMTISESLNIDYKSLYITKTSRSVNVNISDLKISSKSYEIVENIREILIKKLCDNIGYIKDKDNQLSVYIMENLL